MGNAKRLCWGWGSAGRAQVLGFRFWLASANVTVADGAHDHAIWFFRLISAGPLTIVLVAAPAVIYTLRMLPSFYQPPNFVLWCPAQTSQLGDCKNSEVAWRWPAGYACENIFLRTSCRCLRHCYWSLPELQVYISIISVFLESPKILPRRPLKNCPTSRLQKFSHRRWELQWANSSTLRLPKFSITLLEAGLS